MLPKQKLLSHTEVSGNKVQYNTIISNNGSNELIGYKLYVIKTYLNKRPFLEYHIITSSIIPGVHNYKMRCRDIIKEVVKASEANGKSIYLYDSYEAYKYYLENCDNNNTAKADTILENHLIAIYTHKMDDVDEFIDALTFYPFSKGQLNESSTL